MLRPTVEPVMFFFVFAYAMQIILLQDFLLFRFCEYSLGDSICRGDTHGKGGADSLLRSHDEARDFNSFSSYEYVKNDVSATILDDPVFLETDEAGYSWIPKDGVNRIDDNRPSLRDKMNDAKTMEIKYYMAWILGYNLVSVIVSQFIGSIMDRRSKKLLMISPLCGQLICSFFFVMVAGLPMLPLELVIFAGLLSGLSGGFITIKACILSYVTTFCDVTDERHRYIRISLIQGAMYLGGCFGLLYIRFILKMFDTSYAFLFMCNMLVSFIGVFYILLFVPDDASLYIINAETIESNEESKLDIRTNVPQGIGSCNSDQFTNTLTGEPHGNEKTPLIEPTNSNYVVSRTDTESSYGTIQRRHKESSDPIFNPLHSIVGHVFISFKSIFQDQSVKNRFIIKAMLIAEFFNCLLASVEIDLCYVYLRTKVGFNLAQYTLFFGLNMLVSGLMLLSGLPIMRGILKMDDISLGLLGCVSRLGFFLFLAYNNIQGLVYLGIAINMFNQLVFVSTKSILSRTVIEEKQGRAFTVISTTEQIAQIIGTLVFDSLFTLFIRHNITSAIMLIAAAITIIPIVMLCWVYAVVNLRSSPSSEVVEGTPTLSVQDI